MTFICGFTLTDLRAENRFSQYDVCLFFRSPIAQAKCSWKQRKAVSTSLWKMFLLKKTKQENFHQIYFEDGRSNYMKILWAVNMNAKLHEKRIFHVHTDTSETWLYIFRVSKHPFGFQGNRSKPVQDSKQPWNNDISNLKTFANNAYNITLIYSTSSSSTTILWTTIRNMEQANLVGVLSSDQNIRNMWTKRSIGIIWQRGWSDHNHSSRYLFLHSS